MIPMAIIARCRMPPENSWGYCLARRWGLVIPTASSRRAAMSRAARHDTPLWKRRPSASCAPTFIVGFRAAVGSWNTTDKRGAEQTPTLSPLGRRPGDGQVGAEEPERRSRDAQRLLEQLGDREGGERLARTRLADDADRLLPGDPQIHRTDRGDLAVTPRGT